MKTMAHRIHADQFQEMKAAIQAAGQGEEGQALQMAESLIRVSPGADEQPGEIQLSFFAEALRRRIEPQTEEVGNLYLISNDGGQQIKTFNFMAEKFPVVRFSQEIVNEACLDVLRNQASATILDIGIGTGQQMVRLLDAAFSAHMPLKQVSLVGVEPASESLKLAETSLLALAEKYKVELTFHSIAKATEDLTDADWRQLEAWCGGLPGKLLVNASFALHHIRPVSLRTALFVRLKRFSPAILTLIEPYADFLGTDLLERFTNAWHHYGLVFNAIDQIEGSPEDKYRVKRQFFCPEIQDVMSDERHRIERFETGEMWVARLEEAGFKLFDIGDASMSIPNCPFITLHRQNQYLSLNIEGYPILSILAAR